MALTYHLIVPMPAGRLPNGKGRLSVFFSPRLGEDAPLTDWVADWRNWPKVIRGLPPASASRLALRVALNGVVSPVNDNLQFPDAAWISDPPSPVAWDAVFGTATTKSIEVKEFRAILRNPTVLAPMFDAPSLARDLEQLYVRLATESPDDPPIVEDFLADPVVQQLLDSGVFDAYNRHLESLGDGDVSGEQTPDQADFHQAVAYLQSHPQLLRALGLVVDLEVSLPPGFTGTSVSVQSNYDANYGPNRSVRLSVQTNAEFWPTKGPGSWAEIGDGTHDVSQLDLGAGVEGLVEATTGVGPGEPVALPTPRAAGLYLARSGQDVIDELGAAWAAQEDLETRISDHLRTGSPGQPLGVGGELLVVGRRYDVWDATANGGNGQWFSLWERTVPNGYVFPRDTDLSIAPIDDEGWLTYTASTEARGSRVPSGPDPANQELPLPPFIDTTALRVSPVLFSWRNWSLAAQPPGRGFSGVAGPIDVPPPDPGNSAVQVIIPYQVPNGVLPRLRYTHTYKFRARVVDYAGNSLDLTDVHPGGVTETPEITFGRTSNLEPPTVIRREPRPTPGWGDTPTTLVVKSEFQQADETVAPTSRLLFPPQTNQYQCELHGFPESDGLFTTQATFDMVAERTSKSVADHTVVDGETAELISADTGLWRVDVDYLVEVAAAGFAFVGVPGSTGFEVTPTTAKWPEAEAIGIEVRAGDRPPSTTTAPGGPALTAWVPKGITRDVAVSTTISSALVGHWWFMQRIAAADPAAIEAAVRDGQHWMSSQAETVRLVHAVRRPLAIPAVNGTPAVTRLLGRTGARLTGEFSFDVKSTDRLRVLATWEDVLDTPGTPGGVSRPTFTRLLFTQREEYSEVTKRPIDDAVFQLPDTRRYDARISLDALSRYARYFTERATIRFPGPVASVPVASDLAPDGIAGTNVEVTAAGKTAALGADYTVDAATGTITRLAGSRLPVGQDVEVDFLRLPINRRSDEVGFPGVPVIFPNTSVPGAVAIEEVLPAFRRSRGNEGPNDLFVSHSGQVIRVWLRRPWFTTGVGELLGVLVGGPGDVPVTEYARDPLSPTMVPSRSSAGEFEFLDAVERVLDVEGLGVDLVAYDVQFDDERELWFADIAIGIDLGYRPLVKLSLVRYQPESVVGASISEPVVTEPIRLGPNRTTSLLRDGDDIEIDVFGRELGNEVLVRFQERRDDVADPDLGWVDVGDPITLTAINEPFVEETRWNARLTPPVATGQLRLVVDDAELLTRQRPGGPEPVRATAYIETIEIPVAWTADPPDAPTDLTATARHQSAELTWTAPADGGAPIDRYTVERQTGGGGWGDPVTTTATSVVVDGLTNGVAYEFRVRAENAAGPGPWSAVATATPIPTAPLAVGPLEGVSGHQAALVRWPEPLDTGSPITGFRIERRVGGGDWGDGIDLAATSTRYVARGLTNGTTYDFRVRASNALGDGPWSDPASVTPDVMVPAPIRRVVAASAGGLVLLRWRPAAERGAPLLRYVVERRPIAGGGSETPVVVAPDTTQLTVESLAPGTGWEFRVRAENSVGTGTWSPLVTVTVEAAGTVPSAPTGVAVAPSDGSLTATWVEPADGGSPIVSYTVQRRLAGGSWGNSVELPGDQLVHRYVGLTNGTVYGVRVRAANAAGAGDWSVEVEGTPAP